MVNTGTHENLHNFLVDLWNDAEETGGNSRYFRPLMSNIKKTPKPKSWLYRLFGIFMMGE